MFKSKIFIMSIIMALAFSLTGCFSKTDEIQIEYGTSAEGETENNAEVKSAELNIGVLKGPSGLGMAKLMKDFEGESLYNFTLADAPDTIVAKFLSGELQVCAVPTNVASVLYNKTEGNAKILAVNTLGVLYMLDNGNGIANLSDLSGKTIYSTGLSATPQYVLEYILQKNNIDASVEYKSEHAELAALMASGEVTLGMLPEPYVTTVLSKNENINRAINITSEWEKTTGGKMLPMGCIIVNAEFAEKNKDLINSFAEKYKLSTQFANENQDEAAKVIAELGIISDEEVTKKALPNCNITYMTGEDMQKSVQEFYSVLYEADPSSIGGKMPNEDIYFIK